MFLQPPRWFPDMSSQTTFLAQIISRCAPITHEIGGNFAPENQLAQTQAG